MRWVSRARYERLLEDSMQGKVAAAERVLYERLWEEEKAAHAATRAGARQDVKALQEDLRDLRAQKLADERRWAEEARGFNEAPVPPEDAEADGDEPPDPVKAVLDRIDQITNGGPDENTLWFEQMTGAADRETPTATEVNARVAGEE
jgi:hypothetical protein